MAKTEVRLPESSLDNHWLILGRAGVGKSTLIKSLLAYKLRRKAGGQDSGAIVVVDTRGDLVPGVLRLMPQEIGKRVQLLDFRFTERVPKLNLVDPSLFKDRDRSVDTIVEAFKNLWNIPDGRCDDLIRHCLLLLYEYNGHPDTNPEKMLGILDIAALLKDEAGPSPNKEPGMRTRAQLDHVLARVTDPWLQLWFRRYRDWDPSLRDETVQTICSWLGGLGSNKRVNMVFGGGKSDVRLNEALQEDQVVLLSADPGYLGGEASSLLSSAVVTLVESALRDQGMVSRSKAPRCLLVCDELQSIPGPDWELLVSDLRRYGCSMILTSRSLAGEDPKTRRLRASLLGNVACLVGFQMGSEDAHFMAREMAVPRVQERYLMHLDPYQCYLRLDADNLRYLARPLKIVPRSE